ncbi:MAG: glycosyltransferase family 4 protein [Nitrospirae bacterium]|nr:glycosyltransferase family 4 protein [Nitrospirota bacterium]
MNILFQSRNSLFKDHVGDTTQVLKTKEYLEKAGVKVDISLELEPDVSRYDLVHIFNFTRPQETFIQARNAKKYHKKVVLSPIFVDYSEYDKKCREGIIKVLFKLLNKHQIEYCKILGKVIVTREIHKGNLLVLKKGVWNTQKESLKYIDLFLPNSQSEWRRFAKELDIHDALHQAVPNSVDQQLFNPEKLEIDPEHLQFKGCILCVARIDGRKNQFSLVQALKNYPGKLVFVGKTSQHHNKDFIRLKNFDRPNTYFLGDIPHKKLPSLYAVSKVHVLPSYFETTGLSSLEAGAMGCNIVVSDRGDVREYFGNLAYYCEPDSIDSIRNAVLEAYNSPVNQALSKHILENFIWEITASKTLSAYELLFRN